MLVGERSMTQTTKDIIQRIQQIRKLKRRSIHDCAALLDITKEDYLDFEGGITQLTLPDMELLASFFDVRLSSFFDETLPEIRPLSALPRNTRSSYRELRHKMIQVGLIMGMEEAGISLEYLQEMTGIPLETLDSYDKGNSPILIDHLIQISECLGKPISAFYNQDPDYILDTDESHPTQKWQPEYPRGSDPEPDHEIDPYEQLVNALKRIPKEDQAQIAKILLNNLKSL